uniref:Uncharacterized protein n=1 Tax=Amphimedon queenslandica TaxID=400682 RepID=A0A1X7UST7_AMPQE
YQIETNPQHYNDNLVSTFYSPICRHKNHEKLKGKSFMHIFFKSNLMNRKN